MFVMLKANNGQYVVAGGGGNGGMLANRRFGNRWELFEKIELYPETGLGNPATVILRAESGHFLSADDGGGTSIWAKAHPLISP